MYVAKEPVEQRVKRFHSIAGRPVGMSALEREKPADAVDFMDRVVLVVCALIAAGFAIAGIVKAWPW